MAEGGSEDQVTRVIEALLEKALCWVSSASMKMLPGGTKSVASLVSSMCGYEAEAEFESALLGA